MIRTENTINEKDFIDQFINEVCNALPGTTEYIHEVLQARGFLLDKKADGDFVLDNFSTKEDKEKYHEYTSQNNINIYKMFQKGEIKSESCWKDKKWKSLFASNRMHGDRVDVFKLEPFIACYIKPLALIGVHTCSSCDRWQKDEHINDEMHIIFSDRYSMLWLRVLNEHFDKLQDFQIPFVYSNGQKCIIPIHNQRLEIYKKLNFAGKIIYKNYSNLYSIKHKVITVLKGKGKNGKPNNYIYELLKDAYINVMGN